MDTRIFDLHCDTLSAMAADPAWSFEKMPLHVDLDKLKRGNYLLQCMACYVNLGEEKEPLKVCLEMIDRYYRILDLYPDELMQVKSAEDIDALLRSDRIGLMLTVEEGGVCMDDPAVLRNLYRLGVRMMTLTWNYRNGLAWPNNPDDTTGYGGMAVCREPQTEKGLTGTGFAFVEEMEHLHMIVDVSHLSDKGIWDVMDAAKRPFAASHSNARAVCSHVRNLTDDMIREMGRRGCLIGLNFCPAFLDETVVCREEDAVSRISDLLRHARHLINVGGEDVLALGSDLDGIHGQLQIRDASCMPVLAQALADGGFTQRQVEKILHQNAIRFFRDNL